MFVVHLFHRSIPLLSTRKASGLYMYIFCKFEQGFIVFKVLNFCTPVLFYLSICVCNPET
jgi:hypothetical protein